MTIIPVILSGGSGSRLWPLSVSDKPKQFLNLTSDKSMIQETILRLENLKTFPPIVICNKSHRFLVAQQLNELSINASILLEPCAKNTAPAIACCAHQAIKIDKDAVLVVLPSDHVIKNKEAFSNAVGQASKEALNGSLVTFGIVPTCPHTGYGYIKTGEMDKNGIIYSLDRFVEKPDLKTAQKYLNEGTYSWNSGMFVFKAETFLSELNQYEPEMSDLSKKAFENASIDKDFIRISEEYFSQIKGNSIDYAVMERTKLGKVIKLDAGWDDVGSWSALWEISKKDDNHNAVKNTPKAVLLNTKNSYINTKKTCATIGVSNLIIVESDDSILVANKNDVQEVKNVVDSLKNMD